MRGDKGWMRGSTHGPYGLKSVDNNEDIQYKVFIYQLFNGHGPNWHLPTEIFLTEHILIGIASIIVFGVGAQWLAWRLRLPAILLLLGLGFLAGPVAGFINPDELLGDLLLPVVSVSVALILFEGGLSLRIAELKGFGGVVRNLVTIGVLTTWVIGAVSAHLVLGLGLSLSVLLGAVLVVTGPTVIVPLLRHVRPVGHISSILKWEGIVVDPIGAILAVLVFEGIVSGGFREATSLAAMGITKTLLAGGLTGILGAWVMVVLLKRYWIPDFLQSPVTFMAVVGVFTISDFFQAESGLFAVTIMGIILANQTTVTVRHIVEFKENLRVLLISSLFILLAARLKFSDLQYISFESLAFLGALVVLARPASVFLSTIGSGLRFKERLLLMCMAPRGIVAAAIASVFSLRLLESGHTQAELLVPLTFMVIIGTVAIYGLGAVPLAVMLGLARPNPQGVVIAGAHSWARAIARCLNEEGFEVLLVDNNWANISKARMAGLPAYYGGILSEHLPHEVELGGMGRFIALTYNDDICPEDDKRVSQTLRGRLLFGSGVTYSYIGERFRGGSVIKATSLTEEFDFEAFNSLYKGEAVPLFLINEDRELSVFNIDNPPGPSPGHTLISLVKPVEETARLDEGKQ
jgi:NhaP-type Na+/H+ or K+/H+ antiporter